MLTFTHIHHILHLVWDLKSVEDYWEKNFGLKPFRREELPKPQQLTIFYRIGPTMYLFSQSGHVYRPEFEDLRRYGGPVITHVGLAVEDIDKRFQELKEAGVKFIQEEPVISTHGGYKVIDIDPEYSYGMRTQSTEFKLNKEYADSFYGARLQLCEDIK